MEGVATFTQILLERLGLGPAVDGSHGSAPFALSLAGGRTLEWSQVGATAQTDAELSARFAEPGGLEATLRARCFAGSRAVEVSGAIRNGGSDALAGVTGCSTVRLPLRLDPDWAEPLVRSWRGARLIPTFFPPLDFASSDRRLLRMPIVPTSLAVHAGSDGRSSSGDLPFLLLAGKTSGLAVAVEWSGTWFATLEQDPSPSASDRRFAVVLEAGLWGTSLQLRPGQTLPLPTVLLAPYDGDAAAGGNAVRRHVRRHVMPRLGGEEIVPHTSFNHWFGFENAFTDQLLRPAVDAAAAVGLEHFVVDAGWFAGGMPDGIGNWDLVDAEKFPDGVAAFSRYVESRGMRYGTWFEPEFARVESSLYRRHPDWFLPAVQQERGSSFRPWWWWFESHADARGVPVADYLAGYRLLDFGLPEVQEHWVDTITSAHRDWGVRWIRWDCNHAPLPQWNATDEPGWTQIRHVEGLYRVWDHLLDALPDLVIEQCAAGGLRIDLGTVRRGHTFWMNDHTFHTDVVRRMQTRLNQLLPGSYANTNLCQARHDYGDYDFLSHGCGSSGYSGRLWEAPAEDLRRHAEAVSRFKDYRHLLLGDYAFELADGDDRFGHETHVWRDAGEELVLDFNGAGGPGTATATHTRGT